MLDGHWNNGVCQLGNDSVTLPTFQQHNLKKELDMMKHKLKETMTTNEKQDGELQTLKMKLKEYANVHQENVRAVFLFLE